MNLNHIKTSPIRRGQFGPAPIIRVETVDPVYPDPPFKSAKSHTLVGELDGAGSAAQIQAFEDTGRLDESTSFAFHETVEAEA